MHTAPFSLKLFMSLTQGVAKIKSKFKKLMLSTSPSFFTHCYLVLLVADKIEGKEAPRLTLRGRLPNNQFEIPTSIQKQDT